MNLSLLGLCRKAGKLQCGFIRATNCIKQGKAQLVIVSNELSEKTKKEILYFAGKYSCRVALTDKSLEELSKAAGFKAGVFAVTDKGFADKISPMPTTKGDMHYDN